MPTRTVAWLFVAVVVLALASGARADHDWGHRYMVYGRILDAEGAPAQGVDVRVRVETIKGQDPYMTVRTDCHGLYYTLKDRTDTSGAYGEAPDWGVSDRTLHIHEREFRPGGNHHVHVVRHGDEIFHGAWRLDTDLQRSTENIRLDTTVPADAECRAASDWNTTYVVTGRIQTEQDLEPGADRHDAMTLPDGGERHVVRVSLVTGEERTRLEVTTNAAGDYFAVFTDVVVGPDTRVVVAYEEVRSEGKVDLAFRMTTLHMFVREPFISQVTLAVLLGSVGLVVVGGFAIWGYFRYRSTRSTRHGP